MPKLGAHTSGGGYITGVCQVRGTRDICRALGAELRAPHSPSRLVFPTSLEARCYSLHFTDEVLRLGKTEEGLTSLLSADGSVGTLTCIF